MSTHSTESNPQINVLIEEDVDENIPVTSAQFLIICLDEANSNLASLCQ